ncbi:hypothetical protein DM790_25715 [Flavobacterium collinsii]|nr:hypothetical protein [Flavobacterium collinsii]
MKKIFLIAILLFTALSCTEEGTPGKDGKDGTNGIDGKNGADGTSATSQGKEFIIISGNVTNAQVADQLAKEVGPNTEHVNILNTTGLTSLDLSALNTGWEIFIGSNADLVSVNLNGLKVVNNVNLSYNPKLTTVALDNLISVSNLQLSAIGLTSMSLPKLQLGNIGLYDLNSLTSLNAPLFTMGNISVSGTALTSINFPALKIVNGNFMIYNNKKLTSTSFPNLVTINNYNYIYMIDNAFSSTEINKLLNSFNTKISFSGSSKVIYLQSQTPKSPPTGLGITDKNSLIAKGFTITTD